MKGVSATSEGMSGSLVRQMLAVKRLLFAFWGFEPFNH